MHVSSACILEFLVSDADPDANVEIVPMESVSFEDVYKYDHSISIADRKFWIRRWYDDHQGSVVAKNVTTGAISGYGILMTCPNQSYRLQPILAENSRIAKKILMKLLAKIPDAREVAVKVLKENPEAIELFTRIGLDVEKSMVAIVMFSNHQIPVPVNKVFSLMNGMNQVA